MHLLHQCVLLSMHTKKPVSTSFYECNKIIQNTPNTSQYMLMRNSVYKQMNIDIGRRVCEMRPHPNCHDFKVHHPTESPNVYPCLMDPLNCCILYWSYCRKKKNRHNSAIPHPSTQKNTKTGTKTVSGRRSTMVHRSSPRCGRGILRFLAAGQVDCAKGTSSHWFSQDVVVLVAKQPRVRCGKVRFFFLLALQLYQLYTSKKWGWQKLADFEFES